MTSGYKIAPVVWLVGQVENIGLGLSSNGAGAEFRVTFVAAAYSLHGACFLRTNCLF